MKPEQDERSIFLGSKVPAELAKAFKAKLAMSGTGTSEAFRAFCVAVVAGELQVGPVCVRDGSKTK